MKKTKRFWAGLAALALLGGVGAASFSYVASNESATMQVKANGIESDFSSSKKIECDFSKSGDWSWDGSETTITVNGIKWSLSKATYGGKNKGLQIGSKNNPQKDEWTMTAEVSAFGGDVVGVLLKGKTGGSATFKASINGVSALSGSYTTSSGSYFSDKIAPQQDGKVSLTFQGSSKAFYVESVTVFTEAPVAKPSAHADANALAGTVGDRGFVEITAENFKGNVSYSWTSDDESVASIDPDYINAANTMVYFNKKGQTELHCTVTDGTDTVVVNITVSVGEIATDISLSKSELTLTKGESSVLTATLLPEGAVGVVEWSSSNPSVATVADGKVSAEGIGEAVITAKCGELSKTCKVTVNPLHGTVITDPYSPDEAVSHIDDMKKNASETYFVKGVCSKIAFAYNGSESMSIFVGKDSSSKTFEFYKMKVSENPHISIGDIVVASSLGGNATNYKGTYEFNTCTMHSVEYVGLDNFVKN